MVRLISRLLFTVLGTSLVLAVPAPVPADVALGQALNVEPETQQLGRGSVVTLTATVSGTPRADVNVDFEILGGANDPDFDPAHPTLPVFRAPADLTCTTGDAGTCAVTYQDGSTAAQTDRIRAWIDADDLDQTTTGEVDLAEGRDELTGPGETLEPDGTDVIEVTWGDPPPAVARSLDTSPGDPDPALVKTSVDVPVVAKVFDQSGMGFPGANVDLLVQSGPNAGVRRECTTEDDGACSLGEMRSDQEGVARVLTWVDAVDDDVPAPDEADLTEGRDEDEEPGSTAEEDRTDVVEIRYEREAELLDVEDETDTVETGATHTLHAALRTNFQEPRGDKDIAFLVRSGPNRGDAYTCRPGQSGECDVVLRSDQAGTDEILAWVDANENGFDDEADTSEGRDEQATPGETEEPDTTDVVLVNWALPAPECPGHENDPRNHIVGTSDDDVLEGTAAADIICGLGGDDVITGAGGGDLLLGGAGNDHIKGEAGIDIVVAGSGDDEIRGNAGTDELRAGQGVDGVLGGDGDDVLFTRDGRRDRLVDGGRGDDRARRDGNDPTRRVEHFF